MYLRTLSVIVYYEGSRVKCIKEPTKRMRTSGTSVRIYRISLLGVIHASGRGCLIVFAWVALMQYVASEFSHANDLASSRDVSHTERPTGCQRCKGRAVEDDHAFGACLMIRSGPLAALPLWSAWRETGWLLRV